LLSDHVLGPEAGSGIDPRPVWTFGRQGHRDGRCGASTSRVEKIRITEGTGPRGPIKATHEGSAPACLFSPAPVSSHSTNHRDQDNRCDRSGQGQSSPTRSAWYLVVQAIADVHCLQSPRCRRPGPVCRRNDTSKVRPRVRDHRGQEQPPSPVRRGAGLEFCLSRGRRKSRRL
jgi:hypothetical protein